MILKQAKDNLFAHNIKKRLIFSLSAIVSLFFCLSCNNDPMIGMYDNNGYMALHSKTELDRISRAFTQCNICLENEQYSIITRKKALQKGVIEEDYEMLKQSVEQANRLLSEVVSDLRKQGYEVEVYSLSPISKIDVALYAETLTSGEVDGMPKGVIETHDTTPKTEVVFAPRQQVGVLANCIPHAAFCPTHIVTTTYAGGSAKVGIICGTGNITITVPISMSNTNFGISYQTTDTNGGKCVWKGITKM